MTAVSLTASAPRNSSAESRALLTLFASSPYFSIVADRDDYQGVEKDINQGRAMVGIVVPSDFAAKVQAGKPVAIQVIGDGSDANTATLALNYAEAIIRSYSQEVAVTQAERSTGRAPTPALDVRSRVWFNTDMESKNYIVPGLIAVIIMLFAADPISEFVHKHPTVKMLALAFLVMIGVSLYSVHRTMV